MAAEIYTVCEYEEMIYLGGVLRQTSLPWSVRLHMSSLSFVLCWTVLKALFTRIAIEKFHRETVSGGESGIVFLFFVSK